MTYRDDRDADQARITALETELAEAKDKIDELEGKRSQALVLAGGKDLVGPRQKAAKRYFGAPLSLELSRQFDGTISPDRFEDLVELIREATGNEGRTEIFKSSLTWRWAPHNDRGPGPVMTVSIKVKDGVTTLTVTDRLHRLAGALYGGMGGGVAGGAITLPIFTSIAAPYLAPVIFAVWFGGIYSGIRALFKNRARKRAKLMQRVFETLGREIESKLERTPVAQANATTDSAGERRERGKVTEG